MTLLKRVCAAIFWLIPIAAAALVANAQSPLLVENFTYAPGSLLTANGWTAHSGGGTNALSTSVPALTYAGYPSSGLGNSVAMTTSGEDANRTFPVQSSGTVYAALMVNISEASTDPAGGYFFHLGPDPVGTTFRGRLFVKKDASNNVAFGISKAVTTAADIAFTPFSYSLNTTYLVVMKYTMVDGAANDTVSIFVNPTIGSEPGPSATATDTTQTDISLGTVSLRQGAAATAPTVRVGGIRIGTTWASIMTASTPADAAVDFNGDGKTDYVVVRNTGGGPSGQLTWFWQINGAAPATGASDWGLNTDRLVPADFDGDGKDDIAVWRPGSALSAAFYILQSQTNTVRIDVFGQTGDDPTVVADYNGDGKDDVAVYRPGAQSIWFYKTAVGGATTYVPWGVTGDFPTPGDFDGNGTADFRIARSEGGSLRHWTRLSNGTTDNSVLFGLSGDFIVSGDFDGDARTDIMIVRPAGGVLTWYLRPTGAGPVTQATWGLSSDTFAPGDYDGDGKMDIAVFRNGVFYSLNSSNSNPTFFQLGSSGDRIAAAYNVH